MKGLWLLMGLTLMLPSSFAKAERNLVFSDRFDGKLARGWFWLREDSDNWRIRDGALEIRVEPGKAHSVKNVLLREAPDRSRGRVAVQVTVTNLSRPTNQYEQAGITWYHDGKPVYKLVKELIDGKRYIIPGRVPMSSKTVQLRLVATANRFTAQFRQNGKGDFQTVASEPAPKPGNDQVSIQCYNGPRDAEHWIRFDDFRLSQVSESSGRRGPHSVDWAKPLAQDYVVVHKARDLNHPNKCVCVGSPDIIELPSGRLIASMELWLHTLQPRSGIEGGIDYPNHVKIKASDDGGRTWRQISTTGITWGSLFYDQKKEALYLLGADPHKRDVRIVRSTDGGNTWSEPSTLFASKKTAFGAAPTSLGFKEGFVYKAFEGMGISTMFVVAGDMSKDLLDPASWRMSNHLEPPRTAPSFQRKEKIPPMAGHRDRKGIWLLEGNVVEIGGELCVLPRTRIDVQLTTNVCSLLRIKDDGKDLKLEFQRFFPMPGGHNKFKIIRDTVTGYYWTVTSLVPDTSLSREELEAKGFRGNAGNMRRIAMLCYSLDGINWVHAGCVAMSKNPREAFHYTSQVIHGNDLLVLSRSCVSPSKMHNNHDTNMITLHRVKDFRSLALDLRQDFSYTSSRHAKP